jgi:3-oxoacyl-[acyl-carrier protein] reductase
LAYDLAPYHIRVNALIAGAVHTERWDNLDKEIADARRKNYPLGREAYAREVSNAVFYLADDVSNATTGSELAVESGVLLSILPYRDRKKHV